MDKISNPKDENGVLHSIEIFVLERLLAKHDSEGEPSIGIGELIESTDNTMSPLLDQAIEDLVAQSLIHSPDGENYQITEEGIKDLDNRKKEAIPL